MNYAECGNGHVFDKDLYPVCPYCNGGGNQFAFGGGSATSSNVGKTVPVFGNDAISGRGKDAPDDSLGKTVGVMAKIMDRDPVAGWLVCVEGPEKGKDYKVLTKNNSIGRSEKNDICIAEDATISREGYARISYDEKHNQFYLIPGESTNNIYLEDEPVYIPIKVFENQLIEFGDSKFYFVPLCGERFNWKEGLKK